MPVYLHDHAAHAAEGFNIGHVLLDSLADTAKMLPFLFAAYLIIEYVEQRKSHKIESLLARGGRWGFVPGALLGVAPQCGFSAMAANFYGSGVVTLGTLLAVFVATSDEAIPVMLAQPGSYGKMLLLIASKLAWALLVGLLFDVVLRRALPQRLRGGYNSAAGAEGVDCHDHDHSHSQGRWRDIILAAGKHTANIFLVVLAITFGFGLLVAAVGQDTISHFLEGLGLLQPVVAAVVGLIPNCAASVLLTQLYLQGGISFGSVFAGLSANAGIGLAVLFRANKSLRQNFFILGLLFALGVLPGVVMQLFGI